MTRTAAMKPRKSRKQTLVARKTGRGGRVWVARSIYGGKRIPGFRAIDPLTVPFIERASVTRKHANRTGLTLIEARIQLRSPGKLSGLFKGSTQTPA